MILINYSPKNMEKYNLFFYSYYVLFISFLLICFNWEDDNPFSFLYSCSIIALFLLCLVYYRIGVLREKKIFTLWVRPSYIFLLSLLIVNLQTIIDVLLGFGTISLHLETIRYSSVLGKSLFLGIIAISSFLFGNFIAKGTSFSLVEKYKKRPFLYFWVLCSVISFILFVVNIDLFSFLTGLNYKGSGAYDRTVDASSKWETLFDVFSTITLAIVTKKNMAKGIHKSVFSFLKAIPLPFLLVSFLYILLRLLSGDRGPVLYTFLMYFYSYILTSGFHLRLRYIILFVILGAFFISLLNFVRGYGVNQSFGERVSRGFTEMVNGTEANSISPLTKELAKSVNCNFIAINDINSNITTFQNGRYNLCELLASIPGSNYVLKNVFNVDISRYSTAEYVTVSFFGKEYPLGLGTTAVTDFYLDFGPSPIVVSTLYKSGS